MKVALITGASGGIGEAISRLFAKNGYFVGVHCNKNRESASELAKEICGEVLNFDVRDEKKTAESIKAFIEKYGKVDVLVNNAGIAGKIKPLIDTTEEEYDSVTDTNLKGAYIVTKSVLPSMISRGGSIVNVSSMWGIAGGSCEAIYSASKAAIIGFTKALAKEYSGANIRVNAVAPGFIDTKMNDCISEKDKKEAIKEIPLGRLGRAEEVAEAVFFLAEKATFTTGEVLNVSGGEVI